MTVWGIDLGGTKIEGVVLPHSESTEPIARCRVDTEQEGGYDHILHQIGLLVSQLSKESGVQPERIGFGTPGSIEPSTGLLKNSNTLCLNGKPLDKDLSESLEVPCVLANDANCFALAEAKLGAAKGARTVFGVILGTGVGGGVVINGKVLHGAQGIAGEWGHNVLDPDGRDCYCGKQGCNEAVFAGPRLEDFYEAISGSRLLLSEIVSRIDHDSAAQKTVDHLVSSFGRAIAVVINILDPDCIVLGGGVSNTEALYTDTHEIIRKTIFNDGRLETKIVKHELGDSAGVFGAAMLVS